MVPQTLGDTAAGVGQNDIGEHCNLLSSVCTKERFVISKLMDLGKVTHPYRLRDPLPHGIQRWVLEDELLHAVRALGRSMQGNHRAERMTIENKRFYRIAVDPGDDRVGIVLDQIASWIWIALPVSGQVQQGQRIARVERRQERRKGLPTAGESVEQDDFGTAVKSSFVVQMHGLNLGPGALGERHECGFEVDFLSSEFAKWNAPLDQVARER